MLPHLFPLASPSLPLPCFTTPFPAGFLIGPDNRRKREETSYLFFRFSQHHPSLQLLWALPAPAMQCPLLRHLNTAAQSFPAGGLSTSPAGPSPELLLSDNLISALSYLSPKGGNWFPWVTSLYSFFPSFSHAKPVLTITCISFFYLKYLVWFLLYWLVLKCYSCILVS